MGTTFGLAAYFGVKQGFIPVSYTFNFSISNLKFICTYFKFQPNVKYGAVPKVVLGVVLGYFVGKFSYQQKCAEKIMALPDSRLGEILRQRKNQGGLGGLRPDQNLSMGMALGSFTPNPKDVYTDEDMQPIDKGNALNLDVESRPSFAGLDDIYRPNLDSNIVKHIKRTVASNKIYTFRSHCNTS